MTELITEMQMRESMRKKYADAFFHAWTLFELAQEVLGEFKGKAESAYDRAVWMICGRAYKSYHAILNLSEIAYTEDAGIILRSLFNLLVINRWIASGNQDERARKYLGWFWIEMKKNLDYDRGKVSDDLADKALKNYEAHKRFFEYKDDSGVTRMRKKWHEPEAATLEQMADGVGLKDHYEGLYRPLSSIEHSDAVAYFAMVSQTETKDGGPSLALHSDLFVPAYIRNAFQYFAEIFATWNSVHKGVDETKLSGVIQPGMDFFREET